MTVSITARRHSAAGPNPEDNTNMTVTDTDLHHLFNLLRNNRVRRGAEWKYRDTITAADLDDLVYAAEQNGYITLTADGGVKATPAGSRWRNSNTDHTRRHEPAFQSPAVA